MTNQRGGPGSAKTDGVQQGNLQYQVILSCGSTVRFYKLTDENPVVLTVPYHKAQVTTELTALLAVPIFSEDLGPPPITTQSTDTLHQHFIFSSYHFPLLFNKTQRKTKIMGTEAGSNHKTCCSLTEKTIEKSQEVSHFHHSNRYLTPRSTSKCTFQTG